MIFATENAIQKIVSGEKTQTRRLVKKGEELRFDGIGEFFGVAKRRRSKWHTKRVVGRNYAVQSGRGKPRVWYCPKCKRLFYRNKKCYDKKNNFYLALQPIIDEEYPYKKDGQICYDKYCAACLKCKPLRIRLLSIRKEKVLDCTETDAIREGFKNKMEFVSAFMGINSLADAAKAYKNPEVWVLEFSVVK